METLPAGLISTLTVALLHVLIPSHWLCFVVVGKAHGWRPRQTLLAAGAAGAIHVIVTVLLGTALFSLGQAILEQEETLEIASASVLIVLGVLYLVANLFHVGHTHGSDSKGSGKVAYAGLLLSLVVSPCTAVIPFLMATCGSFSAIAIVGGLLLVTTVGGMTLLVGLTSLGIEKLRFHFFDRYEKLIVGLVLCGLGALILLLHHHH